MVKQPKGRRRTLRRNRRQKQPCVIEEEEKTPKQLAQDHMAERKRDRLENKKEHRFMSTQYQATRQDRKKRPVVWIPDAQDPTVDGKIEPLWNAKLFDPATILNDVPQATAGRPVGQPAREPAPQPEHETFGFVLVSPHHTDVCDHDSK